MRYGLAAMRSRSTYRQHWFKENAEIMPRSPIISGQSVQWHAPSGNALHHGAFTGQGGQLQGNYSTTSEQASPVFQEFITLLMKMGQIKVMTAYELQALGESFRTFNHQLNELKSSFVNHQTQLSCTLKQLEATISQLQHDGLEAHYHELTRLESQRMYIMQQWQGLEMTLRDIETKLFTITLSIPVIEQQQAALNN